MALKPPSIFDQLPRMRTSSKPYDPNVDLRPLIQQLTEAITEFGYAGIAPQNLVDPAELWPVIVVKTSQGFRTFIDPQIEWERGETNRSEGCANIQLVCDGELDFIPVSTERPARIGMTHRTESGELTYETFSWQGRHTNPEEDIAWIVYHEIDHLRGKLIVDQAHARLVNLAPLAHDPAKTFYERVGEEVPKDLEKDLIEYAHAMMPFVLIREGERYEVRHGREFQGGPIPDISSDVIFVDRFFGTVSDLDRCAIPRSGERIQIVVSHTVRNLIEM